MAGGGGRIPTLYVDEAESVIQGEIVADIDTEPYRLNRCRVVSPVTLTLPDGAG